jgi:hypothetical protein
MISKTSFSTLAQYQPRLFDSGRSNSPTTTTRTCSSTSSPTSITISITAAATDNASGRFGSDYAPADATCWRSCSFRYPFPSSYSAFCTAALSSILPIMLLLS